MRKLFVLLAASAVLAAPAAAGMGWSARLDATQEIPKQVVKNPAATGSFTATISGKKLKWKLSFAKLTGPATAAHIHMGAMGKAGNVVIALCGPCKSGMTGTAAVPPAVMSAFKKHLLYVNVHTAKNPAGEIRGQLGG